MSGLAQIMSGELGLTLPLSHKSGTVQYRTVNYGITFTSNYTSIYKLLSNAANKNILLNIQLTTKLMCHSIESIDQHDDIVMVW